MVYFTLCGGSIQALTHTDAAIFWSLSARGGETTWDEADGIICGPCY